MARKTVRPVPVLIGQDYEHVMGRAVIIEEPDHVTITIEAKGPEARKLAGFVTADVPIAVSFTAVPVRNAHPKEKK